jgi:hypothetical protein
LPLALLASLEELLPPGVETAVQTGEKLQRERSQSFVAALDVGTQDLDAGPALFAGIQHIVGQCVHGSQHSPRRIEI